MCTLIVGGGLSGLALAEALEARGAEYLLLEARNRLGGRILTQQDANGSYDMGPAWFWPGQPRIASLIARLGLEKFDQFASGALTFEDAQGTVERGRGFASMEGSWRLKGGLGALVDALAGRLPDARKRLDAQVTGLLYTGKGITATLANGDCIDAARVVLALPPRLASGVTFAPALPDAAHQAMQGIATWMAGQAKALAVYETPFWREAGLSGDASSRRGPMVEVHDASPHDGGHYALFGFIGLPPQARLDMQELRHQTLAQLVRLFGPQAAEPVSLYLKDWALDPFTATQADGAPLYAHPEYGLPRALDSLWENRLHFAGTEVAPQFGGYLEGALEAAQRVLQKI
jgi:monoamine oxidase